MQADGSFPGTGPIGAAVGWVQATATGSLASAIAIIAVGWLGIMLMAGRLSRGRAVQLILGCFIIFGAPTIGSGLMLALGLTSWQGTSAPAQPLPAARPAVVVEPPVAVQSYDPYAGAALPPRR